MNKKPQLFPTAGAVVQCGDDRWKILEASVTQVKVLVERVGNWALDRYLDAGKTYTLHPVWEQCWEIPGSQMRRDFSQVLLCCNDDGTDWFIDLDS